MRKVEAGNYNFEIKGITVKEFKKHKLEDYGYGVHNILSLEGTELHTAEEGVDKMLEVGLGKENYKKLEDLRPKDLAELFKGILKETYGSAEEEKNSQTSGTASQETSKK